MLHHVERDQTLETSEPKPAIEDAIRWMQERVTMPAAPPRREPPAEHPGVVHTSGSGPGRGARGAAVPARQAAGHRPGGPESRRSGINGVTLLLAEAPVVVEGGRALVFVGQVSLEGTEGPLTCQMRCRLHRIGSGQEVTFTWAGEMMPVPGMPSGTISSTTVLIPSGAYRGIFFAEGLGRAARRAFCELPLLVVH